MSDDMFKEMREKRAAAWKAVEESRRALDALPALNVEELPELQDTSRLDIIVDAIKRVPLAEIANVAFKAAEVKDMQDEYNAFLPTMKRHIDANTPFAQAATSALKTVYPPAGPAIDAALLASRALPSGPSEEDIAEKRDELFQMLGRRTNLLD